MKKIPGAISNIIVVSLLLFAAHSVQADVVADWNGIAVQSTITAGRPGPTGVVDLAIVHAAMYDAVQAIERRYEPYYVDIPRATGNPVAAAARAANAMTQSLEHFFGTDNITFSVTTTNTGPTVQDTRTYQRLSDAAEDVVNARVYSGIHFRFADEAARKQARQIALWGFSSYMRPVNRGGRPLAEPIASRRR